MPTYPVSDSKKSELEHLWRSLESDFSDFISFRKLDGFWKNLEHGRLNPEVSPELRPYVEGAYAKFGGLSADIKDSIAILTTNPTNFGVKVRGVTEQAKKVESSFKLAWSSWWMNDLNVGRLLDSANYEGAWSLGVHWNWIRWRKKPMGEGVSGCPVYIQDILPECVRWKGNPMNPSWAVIKYSVSAIDCDMKNAKGERPAYKDKDALDSLGWVSQPLPEDFYTNNAGKEIDVIIEDAEDMVAMCPVPGHYHRKRRICIYICKKGGKPEDYEIVEEYDSPFEQCSFIPTGGDLRLTERDPHLMFRPPVWVLYSIIDEYNARATELNAMLRRELADENVAINAGSTNAETVNALTRDAEGGNKQTIDKPETGTKEYQVVPGAFMKVPGPSLEGLLERMRQLEREYERRRPNPALLGQMTISEVAATVGQLQVQGAGVPVGPTLANWDVNTVRIIKEIKHGISFTSYFEPDGEKTRYMAMVTGKERVYGTRLTGAGEDVYIDAKMCDYDVFFEANTSKDTPSERQQRIQQALDLNARGFYNREDVYEAIGVYDAEAQDEKIAAEFVDKLLMPMFARGVAATTTGRFTARTGVDFGATLGVDNIPLPGDNTPQTRNTQAANAATTVAPAISTPPTGTPTGGSDGMG